MNASESSADGVAVIDSFYAAFAARDHEKMAALYADNATFEDPVFGELSARQARGMWEMLCVRGEDLEITWGNVGGSGSTATADWEADYTFTATGRSVNNKIAARFEIRNGKIARHRDEFDFYRWARQALGPRGVLLGWTPLVKNKVRARARRQLERFMAEAKD